MDDTMVTLPVSLEIVVQVDGKQRDDIAHVMAKASVYNILSQSLPGEDNGPCIIDSVSEINFI